jgi:hypothetical protein
MSFIAPKHLGSTPFYTFKRLPRKKKKELNKIIPKYSFLTIQQRMWWRLEITNRAYRDFLIQQICK